mgnify:CR=1 FL=1
MYKRQVLEAIGISQLPDHHFDGVSFLPILKSATTGAERPLFWHYPHYGNQGGAPGAAVLLGEWKLLEWFDDSRVELYNLNADVSETKNAAESESQRVSEMLHILHTWQTDVGAKFSAPNPDYNPAKPSGRN